MEGEIGRKVAWGGEVSSFDDWGKANYNFANRYNSFWVQRNHFSAYHWVFDLQRSADGATCFANLSGPSDLQRAADNGHTFNFYL